MFRALLILTLATGCGPDATGPVLSPTDGSTITAPVIPVISVVDSGVNAPSVRIFLDGKNVSDPKTVVRTVYNFMGGERHMVAALDLTEVDPGEHELEIRTGRWPSASSVTSTFTLAPPDGTVQLRIEDEDGALSPGRVYIFDADGPVELASDGTLVDHNQRDADQNAVFCPSGECMAWLEPGDYRLVGWRGLAAELDIQQVSVSAGENRFDFTVPTAIDLTGEAVSDLHIHTGKSIDAWIPDTIRFAALNSVGLDLYVITEHNHVTDAPGRAEAAHPDPPAQAVTGSEVDLRLLRDNGDGHAAAGHINVFPLAPEAPGMPDYHKDTMAEVIHDHLHLGSRQTLAEVDDHVVLQLNHPRGIHFHPGDDPEGVWQVFDWRGFDRSLPPGEGVNEWMGREHEGTTALDFHVLEVVNRFSMPLYREVRADWFSFLDHGIYRTASGNSDAHGLTVELAGMTVTLVEADREDDGSIDLNQWIASLQAGRARVSTGLFVSIEAAGATPGDTLTDTGSVSVQVRVQAASWVPVSEARLISRSQAVWTHAIDATERGADGSLDVTYTVDVDLGSEDGWLVAEAGYPLASEPSLEELGLYADLAPGYVPLGFTNAIRIDADGKPGWSPSPRFSSARSSGN
ncbi:MAG: CehA/McbA family metallohydrolase [Proteobacteria bacterium]|nr:CehA/McbA family metallohydrolase [Pseudomonadota bacterium]